jgi:hypothetical protein
MLTTAPKPIATIAAQAPRATRRYGAMTSKNARVMR